MTWLQGRRDFLDRLLRTSFGALLVAVLYPVLRFLNPPRIQEAAIDEVDAGPENDPALLDKGFKIVRFGGEPVILIRVAAGDFRAFSAVCTHLQCIVEFRRERKVIWCNCQNGVFDLNGRNIAGPPPRPLARFVVHRAPGRDGGPASLIVSKT